MTVTRTSPWNDPEKHLDEFGKNGKYIAWCNGLSDTQTANQIIGVDQSNWSRYICGLLHRPDYVVEGVQFKFWQSTALALSWIEERLNGGGNENLSKRSEAEVKAAIGHAERIRQILRTRCGGSNSAPPLLND